jgi:hypothetical protein
MAPLTPGKSCFPVVRRVFDLFPAALKRLFPAVRFHSLRERRVLLPSSDDRIDEFLLSSVSVPRRVQPRALRDGPQLVEFHGTNVLDGDVEEPGDVGAPIPLEQVIGGDRPSHAR